VISVDEHILRFRESLGFVKFNLICVYLRRIKIRENLREPRRDLFLYKRDISSATDHTNLFQKN
jgi:hypothetical protein